MTRALPPMNASTAALNPHVAPASGKRGTSAKLAGTTFEDVIAAELETLRLTGKVAAYSRHDARKIERAGVVTGRVPGACDFSGILPNGARGFVIEVKSTVKGDVWITREHAKAAKRARDPALTSEQHAQLVVYTKAGGIALLAAKQGDRVSIVQWADVRVDARGALWWVHFAESVAAALR